MWRGNLCLIIITAGWKLRKSQQNYNFGDWNSGNWWRSFVAERLRWAHVWIRKHPPSPWYVIEIESAHLGIVITSPLELVRQIRQLTQNPVVANNVTLSAILHPDLQFDRVDSPQGLSRVVKGTRKCLLGFALLIYFLSEIGNATSDTDVTLEFSIRARGRGKGYTAFPFQMQIKFTKLDGAQILRVVSVSRNASTDRTECEKTCNVSLVGLSAIQHAAAMASLKEDESLPSSSSPSKGKGDSTRELASARLRLRAVQRMFERCRYNGKYSKCI